MPSGQLGKNQKAFHLTSMYSSDLCYVNGIRVFCLHLGVGITVFESDKQDYKRRTYCQLAASQRFCDSCLWFEDLLLQDWYTCEKVKCNCSMCVLHATIISILQPAVFVLSPRSSQSIHSVRSYEVYAYQCLFNVYKIKDVGKETACSFPCVWVCF